MKPQKTPVGRTGFRHLAFRVVALGGLALSVSACGAIPTPLSVVTYAVDGVSYLVSGKSVTDHGLSYVMGKDCAMLRPLWGDPICEDENVDGETAVAEADMDVLSAPPVPASTPPAPAFSEQVAIAGLPQLAGDAPGGVRSALGWAPVTENAAGDVIAGQAHQPPIHLVAGDMVALNTSRSGGRQSAEADVQELASFDTAAGGPIITTPATTKIAPAIAAPVATRNPALSVAHALGGVKTPLRHDRVMVIGSFANREGAERHARSFAKLEPFILAVADTRNGQRFRVAIGPFPVNETPIIEDIAERAGIRGAWPLTYVGRPDQAPTVGEGPVIAELKRG